MRLVSRTDPLRVPPAPRHCRPRARQHHLLDRRHPRALAAVGTRALGAGAQLGGELGLVGGVVAEVHVVHGRVPGASQELKYLCVCVCVCV